VTFVTRRQDLNVVILVRMMAYFTEFVNIAFELTFIGLYFDNFLTLTDLGKPYLVTSNTCVTYSVMTFEICNICLITMCEPTQHFHVSTLDFAVFFWENANRFMKNM